jgi:hypothetical protein
MQPPGRAPCGLLQRELPPARLRKARWSPYTAADVVALDVLPPAARKMLIQEVRRKYMLELIKNGTVLLVDIAQIDGMLDAVPVPKRRLLLSEIEEKCRGRADDGGLATIARWRRSQRPPTRR